MAGEAVRDHDGLAWVCGSVRAASSSASSRWTMRSCSCSSARALRGFQCPAITNTNGMNTSWQRKQIHHQVRHWPGLSLAAWATYGALADR